jgi:catechol 2,3-dioxygenase-like lactoylglutathione lyase family enzyme
MQKPARVALKVHNLPTSLTFYVDRLGFQLVKSQPDADVALVLDPYGDHLLLAGPAVEDVRAHLRQPPIIHEPGATLDFAQEDLDARLAMLTARGLTDIQQRQTDEGDRMLIVKDPSNSTILFVQQRSAEKTRMLYLRGGDDVVAALAGLAETDLDLACTPEEWSIRQIVHHLAEMDAMHLMMVTSALAQPGYLFIRNHYDQDDQNRWAETLVFKERAIEPSLALMKAVRQHLAQLFQHIPDHWDRPVRLKFVNEEGEGTEVTVGAVLDGLTWHLAQHCADIREIRCVHNR